MARVASTVNRAVSQQREGHSAERGGSCTRRPPRSKECFAKERHPRKARRYQAGQCAQGALTQLLKGRDTVGPTCVYTASMWTSVTGLREPWPMREHPHLPFLPFYIFEPIFSPGQVEVQSSCFLEKTA